MPTQQTPRAYGPHRRPTPKEQAQEKAHHVARSIVAHGWALEAIPWARYGPRLAASAAARQAVLAAVAQLWATQKGGEDGMD